MDINERYIDVTENMVMSSSASDVMKIRVKAVCEVARGGAMKANEQKETTPVVADAPGAPIVDYCSKNKPELIDECKRRKLDHKGNKDDLIARLVADSEK